jgi:hypothetical protein
MLTEPGVEITWGELRVGSRIVFFEAGPADVAHQTATSCASTSDPDADLAGPKLAFRDAPQRARITSSNRHP